MGISTANMGTHRLRGGSNGVGFFGEEVDGGCEGGRGDPPLRGSGALV